MDIFKKIDFLSLGKRNDREVIYIGENCIKNSI